MLNDFSPKAVIFDMDGLLVDSEPFWQEAESEAFCAVGVPWEYSWAPQTMGMRVDEAVEHWFSRFPWDTPTKEEVTAKLIARVITLIREKGFLCPGVMDALHFFDSRKIPMAIASSSHMDIIRAVVDGLDIGIFFKVLHSAEYERRGKPHPDVFLTAAKMLGAEPEECLVFEDSPNGILAAKAANMKCVAVPNPFVKDDPRLLRADLILNSLEDFSPQHLTSP